ncbi:pyruvate formate lyase activating enzyme [Sporolituus thermophilus DSM 23256]|uniref:Pyruvate formate-lyase-activating enzyme n=2 Tax=Sporolituus TaxID=909931 RepID=A0A1G7L1F9_9FIRM|nr:pyruvate formate lyase activating enzyme [Sporolituus thermophilus DSM 23256]
MPLGLCHSCEPCGTVDGQGIRYVLFLAGCALRCKFCHNPDTWQPTGRPVTLDAVLSDLARYEAFYRFSGGGVTVSGGEPLLQAEFVAALFRACRRQGIHTTLDTAGFASPEKMAMVLPYTDAVLFSIKAALADKHVWLTGRSPGPIGENLRTAVGCAPVTVRYVVIPGLTDTAADFAALADLLHGLPRPVSVELLPYHTLGRAKWEGLGRRYPLAGVPAARREQMLAARAALTAQGIRVIEAEY